jgi:hypothetical protein
MMVPDNSRREPAYQEAVKQQQRVDFERSVKYCREELGVAWRGLAWLNLSGSGLTLETGVAWVSSSGLFSRM